MICRNQPIFYTVYIAFRRHFTAGSMQVSIKTFLHIIFRQHLQNFIAYILAIHWRIMQKTKFFFFSSLFQRCLQTHQFPKHYFFIVLISAYLFFIKPASGPANSYVSIKQAVIVQDLYVVKSIFFKKGIHLRFCIPPVIVIPF